MNLMMRYQYYYTATIINNITIINISIINIITITITINNYIIVRNRPITWPLCLSLCVSPWPNAVFYYCITAYKHKAATEGDTALMIFIPLPVRRSLQSARHVAIGSGMTRTCAYVYQYYYYY